MQITEGKKIQYALIWLAIGIIIILPARCYNGFYLPFFAVNSNISVQYVNIVDLAVIVTALLCILCEHQLNNYKVISHFFAFYFLTRLLFMIAIFFGGYVGYFGELLSKTTIVGCAAIIAVVASGASDTQKSLTYFSVFLFLSVASFFLVGYGGYGLMNRTGSVGFGSNETACFACALLAIVLFVNFTQLWFRIVIVFVSLACALNIASRRGMIISIAIFIIWLIYTLMKRKSRFVDKRRFYAVIILFFAIVLILYFNRQSIVDYINDSALMTRINFTEKQNHEVIDLSDRLSVYKEAFQYINLHPILGSFGCDLIYAQGSLSHAHNLLLQNLVTNGIFIGIALDIYLVVTLVRAFILLRRYCKAESTFPTIISIFFIVYMLFDFFGYLLWNPKGLFWIAITTFFIQIEYSNQSKGIEDAADYN